MVSAASSSTSEIKEAHRIKSISFLGSPRHILLQNKNGPCPLLAAANALLLRGAITLPGRCISAGQVSIDDVINILAERAVAKTGEHCALAAITSKSTPAAAATSTDERNIDESKPDGQGAPPVAPPTEPDLSPRVVAAAHAQHHLHEVLSLIPSLQHGLDVNPKFTAGPTGVEYTSNLTCFDLLGVELVHGWLLDPQDVETVSVVRDRTYNELVEVVIRGNEAGEEVDKVGKMIAAKEAGAEIAVPLVSSSNTAIAEPKTEGGTKAESNEEDDPTPVASTTSNNFPPQQISIEELRAKHREQSGIAHEGHVVNSFLTSTSHQLTYHGLSELHNHLPNHSLCVFFRNNHCATLTKEDDALFLLVTDLGYANVPEVVWEKLDAIDGATTLFDEYFSVPQPRASMGATAGPTLSSEEIAGQSGQVDADHQLALHLSKHSGSDRIGGGNSTSNTKKTPEEQEGRLVAAATEASTQDWLKSKSAGKEQVGVSGGVVAVGVPSAPPGGTIAEIPRKESGANDNISSPAQGSQPATDRPSFVPSDEQIARELQAQMNSDHESEALARRLQAEDDAAARQRQAQQQQQQQRPTGRSSATSRSSVEDKSCVIS
eukprot:CAMPEP_0185808692 /NCGR_PEP_ID=MMETSP1322-20130828/5761_1 /TAXON_ID=265543 /ORGANISM="Minutocellus polymorphus, Strain RCC2270" /LENGTH=604 /DNA_ID=CAMNT_0028504923 /DNA_START=263 /DNA_END=2077 /DNA_ORIENTATION=+